MTRKLTFPKLLNILLLLMCASFCIMGQNEPAVDPPNQQFGGPNRVRPNLLRELGLSPEQIQQLRRMRSARRPVEQEARRRFREANRSLNEAIYADSTSDEEVRTRLKEFQLAQAELARTKFTGELADRKVLTPEQLAKFRELRGRFAAARGNIEQRRQRREANRLNRQQRRIPNY